MKMHESKAQPLERLLAATLRGGTWIASAAILAGLLAPALASRFGYGGAAASAATLVKSGIGLFILLPVLRLVLMLIAFVRAGDYRMGAVAGLVLGIIVLGCVIGTMSGLHA